MGPRFSFVLFSSISCLGELTPNYSNCLIIYFATSQWRIINKGIFWWIIELLQQLSPYSAHSTFDILLGYHSAWTLWGHLYNKYRVLVHVEFCTSYNGILWRHQLGDLIMSPFYNNYKALVPMKCFTHRNSTQWRVFFCISYDAFVFDFSRRNRYELMRSADVWASSIQLHVLVCLIPAISRCVALTYIWLAFQYPHRISDTELSCNENAMSKQHSFNAIKYHIQ